MLMPHRWLEVGSNEHLCRQRKGGRDSETRSTKVLEVSIKAIGKATSACIVAAFRNSDYIGISCRPSGVLDLKGATNKNRQSKLAKQLDEERPTRLFQRVNLQSMSGFCHLALQTPDRIPRRRNQRSTHCRSRRLTT